MNKQNIAQKQGEREALRRIAEVNQTGATQLDLSNLRLTSLPEAIGNLTALQELSRSNAMS